MSFLLLALCLSLRILPILSNWNQFHGRSNKSGVANVNGPRTLPQLEFRTSVGCHHWGASCWVPGFTGTDSSPAIGPDGTVYIGSYDKHIYAVDAQSGQIKWNSTAGSSLIGIESSPAVNEFGEVVVGSYNKGIWCYNGTTGAVVWQYNTAGYVASAPALSEHDGGLITYVGSVDGCLYALEMATGRLVWKYNSTQSIWGPPSVSNGLVFFGSGGAANPYSDKQARIHAVNASTGVKLFSILLGQQIQSCPALNGNKILYVGNYDHCVYAINTTSISVLWKTCTAGRIESSVALYTAAITTVDMVVVGSADGFVYGLTQDTGRVVWKTNIGKQVGSSPAVDSEGRVYIGGDPGIYCLNGTDGRVIWKYQTTTLIGSSPALSNDGSLLVGGEDGWLYKLVGG